MVYLAGLASWGAGDTSRARKLLESLSNEGSTYWKVLSRLSVGRLLSFQGHMAEARNAFQAGLALAQMPGFENWVPVFQFHIATIEITTGHSATAKKECLRYRRAAEKAPILMNLQRGANLFLQIGGMEQARHFELLARQQVAKSPDPFSEMQLHTLTSSIDLASHDATDAAKEAQASLAFRSWYTPYLALGSACEAEKNWDCAIQAYSHYLDFKGAILSGDATETWVMTQYSLARIYFEAGDTRSGDARYDQFLALFSEADSELPILSRARDEVAHWHRAQSNRLSEN